LQNGETQILLLDLTKKHNIFHNIFSPFANNNTMVSDNVSRRASFQKMSHLGMMPLPKNKKKKYLEVNRNV